MDRFAPFRTIAHDPADYARSWKARTKKKIVGTFCSYAPEEILLAADVLGYRIFGTGSQISRADMHLQSYGCSLVRGALEESLAGRLDFLDGVVFPHTCDSIMRLSDIWRMNLSAGFHMDLVMPVKLTTDSARDYMIDVFKTFQVELEKILGRSITDSDLREAVDVCNRIRKAVQRIYTMRTRMPWAVPGRDIQAMVRAAMVMDRREFLGLAEAAAQELETDNFSPCDGKRLVLSGGLCTMPDVYSMIEDAGAWVVADDLCTGTRFFEGMVDTGGDPVEAIAGRYTRRTVCPAKHSGIRTRGEHLVRMVKETGARGVLFLFLKFCDPHGFDYPYLKSMLEKEGIPCMLHELDDNQGGGGQFRTRCEAFVEML
ncbi:MAG: 2-hydroxyacyl-CoA dehydratase family protein [Pseudomonadota bacterium]